MVSQLSRRRGRDLICPVCGSAFYRKRAELRAVNYCSVKCSATANYALDGVNKGRRRSPGTEFAAGTTPHNHTPVGTVRVRRRKNRNDAARAWVKVAEPNVWQLRAVLVYETAHGPRTPGRVIHHVDGDSLNDDPTNLVELTRSEHMAVHAGLLSSSKVS